VVGDPLVSPPHRQLAGAKDEAAAVSKLLSTKFEVEQPDSNPSALQVLAGLYKQPYRIVHLAGHGHYEAPTTAGGKARSGMVLDNGVLLTAVEVGQMQQVPELVFLNCCHIGQTGPEAGPRPPAVEFNRLAASVSRELIQMGVRAVMAAGWAVQDAAAKLFAETFYNSMLNDGETFGRALKFARNVTRDGYPRSNTWGAYQAYGDPDYRLDPTGAGGLAADLGRVDVAEFVEAVRDIGRSAAGGNASRKSGTEKLRGLVKDCPRNWLEQTDVQMAIGDVYGSLGEFEEARRYLLIALGGEGGASTTTLRAVEQLANFEARLADQIPDDQFERSRELHKSAVGRLERLLTVSETAERYNLLGSAHKRRAAAERNPRTARRALSQAADNYRRAHELNLKRQGLDPYSTLNWLTVATLLGEQLSEADELIERCEATGRERFLIDRDFFTAVAWADARLVRTLMQGQLGAEADDGAAETELRELQSRYHEVIERTVPSARELDSTCCHIEVISIVVGTLGSGRREAKAAAERLTRLSRAISGDPRS
jgi:tetratricopeptide (TPR) repeat protein